MQSDQKRILKELDELIAVGKALPLEKYSHNDIELRSNYNEWKAMCLFTFKKIFGASDPFYRKLEHSLDDLHEPKAEKVYALRLLERAKSYYLKLPFFEKLRTANEEKVKQTRFFISYQQDHVEIACKIQDIILRNSDLKKEDVFVAHRDIPLSEEWRKKMIDELENSTHLLVLCTANYQCSAFGNQEVGYAIAKHMKIAPIFWQGSERRKFGFLEGYQSLPQFADDNTIEKMVKRILSDFGIE